MWLTFPGKEGIIYKAKLLLVHELSVNLLIDINMLIQFEYKFNDEIPPVFKHEAQQDEDLGIIPHEELFKLPRKQRWNREQAYRWCKESDNSTLADISFYDHMECMGKVIYDDKYNREN